ncbi:hypothetical protein C0989_006555 [Termitomyces sp. Mn162]|nr:hypothetical protein C0989_006555 [Termitomyces sp. Mn162]
MTQQKMVTSKEGEEEQEDVEMREKTPLATVAKVKPVVGKKAEEEQEVEEEVMKVEKDKESKDEVRT